MEILPNEVESIKVIGNLFDDEVKIIKCIGGFHVAVGKRNKRNKNQEALAAGSHPALVAHQLHKQFGSDFQPAIMKSEHDRMPTIEDKSTYLSRDNIEKGIELYVLQKHNDFEFIACKNGITLCKYDATAEDNKLLIKSYFFNKKMLNPNRNLADSLAKSINDKLYELKLSEVEYNKENK